MAPLLYSTLPIDRAHALRRDPAAMAACIASADRRVVPMWRELSLTQGDEAALIGGTEGARLIDLATEPLLLGLMDGRPLVAVDLSAVEPEADGGPPALGLSGTWQALKAIGGTLGGPSAALLAYARAVVLWSRRARFCGTCGAPTRVECGGLVRQCLDEHCRAQTHPRLDPAVIMRVDGTDSAGTDAILMHRQRAWPPGMWSVLAGFVEPGETLEEAVAREVREETGIIVADARYHASQPWPFPSSLMLGFSARAVGGTLAPDLGEIEDADWFSRDRIARDFDERHRTDGSGLFLPRKDAIARLLIDDWLQAP